MRVEPEDSNPVLSRRKIAGDFSDLVPGDQPLLKTKWSRTDQDSILRNDRWLGRLQRYEEDSRTHASGQNHETDNCAKDDERRAAPRRQWRFASQHLGAKAEVLSAPVKSERTRNEERHSDHD